MTKDLHSKDSRATDDERSKDGRSAGTYRKPTLVVYGDLATLTRNNPPGGGAPDGLVIGQTIYRTS